MKVAVLGLWHQGSVTAACLAEVGHDVVGWDPDAGVVAKLAGGKAPIGEPGLDDLVSRGIAAGRLRFTPDLADAVPSAGVVWIAFDTPVDDNDRADVEAVMGHAARALPFVSDGAVVLSSAQLPVGSMARLERELARVHPGREARVAYSPENLRLGRAIERFLSPDRVVVGTRTERDRAAVAELFAPVTDRIVWMSVESAEMTKHAINAFLATSVAFINEIAAIGETVGADAKEVERGLKSDQRIGPAAYLSPGAAFAGGTLARDLAFLGAIARDAGVPARLVDGVLSSNREHLGWVERVIAASLRPLAGRTIAVWGLTYKPGTDTLRRAASVELVRRLAAAGVDVRAFDPAVRQLPPSLEGMVTLAESPVAAATGADAIVVGTEWPVFREVQANALLSVTTRPLVVDPGRFLSGTLGSDVRVRYLAVGTPRS